MRRYFSAVERMLGDLYLVIMLDEFQSLETHVREQRLDQSFFAFLRGEMQHRHQIVYLLASSSPLDELSPEYFSVLLNIALCKEIGHLDRDAAIALIQEPVQGFLDYDDLALDKILRITDCHPYFLQVVCFQLVELMNSAKKTTISISDVNESIDRSIERSEPHIYDTWAQLSSDCKITLSSIAELQGEGGRAVSSETIRQWLATQPRLQSHYVDIEHSLLRLVNKGILKLSTSPFTSSLGPLYSVKVELLRRWVRNHYPVTILSHGAL